MGHPVSLLVHQFLENLEEELVSTLREQTEKLRCTFVHIELFLVSIANWNHNCSSHCFLDCVWTIHFLTA